MQIILLGCVRKWRSRLLWDRPNLNFGTSSSYPCIISRYGISYIQERRGLLFDTLMWCLSSSAASEWMHRLPSSFVLNYSVEGHTYKNSLLPFCQSAIVYASILERCFYIETKKIIKCQPVLTWRPNRSAERENFLHSKPEESSLLLYLWIYIQNSRSV